MIRNQKYSWFRQAILGLPILLISTLGHAEIISSATETITLSGGSSTQMGVAYIPSVDRYYAASGSYTISPTYVFNNAGALLGSANPGVDNRGIYYNPNTNKLESVSYNASFASSAVSGVMSLDLDASGDYTGTNTQLLAAPISALGHANTMPSYDPFNGLLYAKSGDTVYVVQRADGALSTTITLDLAMAGVVTADLNSYFIGFTGKVGHELAVLDKTNKQVLIFDLSGAYVGASTLPADLDVSQATSYGTGYANDQFFIYDDTVGGYRGFKVLSIAPETITLRGVIASSQMGVAYIPSVDRYYAASGGYTTSPAYFFDNAGTLLGGANPGVDNRGIYYNPNTNKLESVSYAASGGSAANQGIMSLDLDFAGNFTGTHTQLLAAPIPALGGSQTMPSYDPFNDLLYAKNGDTVNVVQRADGALSTTITLDLATAGVITADLNTYFIGFTAVNGHELAVLDKTNKRVLIFDINGAYVSASDLPGNLDVSQATSVGTGYANDQFFIYDATAGVYRGFKVVPAAAADIDVTDSLAPAGDLQIPFGGVNTDSSSLAIVTLTNQGYPALTITNVVLSGADASQFSIDFTAGATPCSGLVIVINGGQNCTLGVTFTPQSDGAKSAALDIISDDPDEANVSVALSGSGVTPEPTPAAGGGGGGGCTINSRAAFDPLLPLMVILGSLYLCRQKKEQSLG